MTETNQALQIEMTDDNNNNMLNATSVSDSDNSSEGEFDIVRIASCVIASVGIVANLTVVVAFLNSRKLRRKIPNIFIINQSLIDFVISVILLLETVTISNTKVIHNGGVLGSIECRLWNTKLFMWGLFISSTWNIVSMTVERYLELVHPMWHKANFKIRWIYISFVINWLFGSVLTGAHHIPTTKVISGECLIYAFWPSVLVSSIVGVFLIFIQFLIPLIILIYCYGRIVWILSRRIGSNLDSSGNQGQGQNLGQTDKFQLARTNTIKTLLIVALCFVICWINNQIYYLMYNLGYDVNWDGAYYKFTVLMIFVNCTINPFVYLIKYRDYQEALQRCFGCCFRSKKLPDESRSISSSDTITKISYN